MVIAFKRIFLKLKANRLYLLRCTCESCQIIDREVECLCCQEIPEVLNKNAEVHEHPIHASQLTLHFKQFVLIVGFCKLPGSNTNNSMEQLLWHGRTGT